MFIRQILWTILILIQAPLSEARPALDRTCAAPQKVRAIPSVPTCDDQKSCITDDRIRLVRDYSLFPMYGDSMKKFENEICHTRQAQLDQIPGLTAAVVNAADLTEAKIAVDLVHEVKANVDRALEKSRERIKWVNNCVEAFSKNESYNPDGSFSAEQTSKKFKAARGKTPESCAALWDKTVAKTPILNVLTEELTNSRLYKALGSNWSQAGVDDMTNTSPLIEGEFFKNLPEAVEPLNEMEKAKIVETRDRLLQECVEENTDECMSIEALQAYAKKRYSRTISENPILMYFSRSVDPKKPIRASELASAYRQQQEKMNKLMSVKLKDQDYLQFPYFVDAAIKRLTKDKQGDTCAVLGALLENPKAKANLYNGIMIAGAVYGGASAFAAKGVLGRIFAFLGGLGYGSDVYITNQIITHYEVMRKLESTCSQSHMRASGLCNVQTIQGNADSLVTDGLNIGLSGFMSAFSLYGPAKALITGLRQ